MTAVFVACTPLSVRATFVAAALSLSTTREPDAEPVGLVPTGVTVVAAELELAPKSLVDSSLAAAETGPSGPPSYFSQDFSRSEPSQAFSEQELRLGSPESASESVPALTLSCVLPEAWPRSRTRMDV